MYGHHGPGKSGTAEIHPTEQFEAIGAKVGCGALSIVGTPLRNVGHPHPLRTSAIAMQTRMDGIASAGTERDLRVRSVAPPSSVRYLDRRVVEAGPFGKIRPEICGDQSRDCLPGAACRQPCALLAGNDPRWHVISHL